MADYCDIIRCDVLKTLEEKIIQPDVVNTDIEIWREASAYRTELAVSGSKDLVKYKKNDDVLFTTRKIINNQKKIEHCEKYEGPDGTATNNNGPCRFSFYLFFF